MSNLVNETIKENIASDVYDMANDDIWNVIHAIADDYGIFNETHREAFLYEVWLDLLKWF